MQTIRRILLLALAFCLAAAPMTVTAESQDNPPALQIITDNTKLDLSPYAGKAIYLNFFTQWCPYCMREMPDLKKLYEQYSPEELQIILVHVWDGEDATQTEDIRTTYGLEEMTFFEDEDLYLATICGLQGYPLSLFLNKDGYVHSGVNAAMSYEQMEAVMAELGVSKRGAAK